MCSVQDRLTPILKVRVSYFRPSVFVRSNFSGMGENIHNVNKTVGPLEGGPTGA